MLECLCDDFGRYISWAYATGSSDHKAILLELDFDKDLVHYPFKFNHVWIADKYFCTFVQDSWDHLFVDVGLTPRCHLVKKLNYLKMEIRKWEKHRKAEYVKDLVKIEEEFERLSNVLDDALFSSKRKEILLFLDNRKRYIWKI